jgi:hypothetical protein
VPEFAHDTRQALHPLEVGLDGLQSAETTLNRQLEHRAMEVDLATPIHDFRPLILG